MHPVLDHLEANFRWNKRIPPMLPSQILAKFAEVQDSMTTIGTACERSVNETSMRSAAITLAKATFSAN